jgi:hypothetical protein
MDTGRTRFYPIFENETRGPSPMAHFSMLADLEEWEARNPSWRISCVFDWKTRRYIDWPRSYGGTE